jgi:hypothetical protein
MLTHAVVCWRVQVLQQCIFNTLFDASKTEQHRARLGSHFFARLEHKLYKAIAAKKSRLYLLYW